MAMRAARRTRQAGRTAATAAAAGALATCALAACAAKRIPASEPPAPGEREPVAAAAESAVDAVVARVNGLPVHASCIAHQAAAARARAGAAPAATAEARRRQALDECLGFELLAQEAAARRLAGDPAVQEARRTAAVSRLIELEIDDKVQTAAGFPPAFAARVLERNRWRMHREDYRASAFARFLVPASEPTDGPVDRAARAAAERVAAALADQRGLFPDHLMAKARELAGGQPLQEGSAELSDAARLVRPYSEALFAIPEIGRTSQPVRTEWGWDVILWTGQLPPRDISEAALAAELFPDSRLAYFTAWSKSVGRNVRVQINPEAVALLDRHFAEEPASPSEGQRGAPGPAAPPASPALRAPAPAPATPTTPTASPTPAPEGRP